VSGPRSSTTPPAQRIPPAAGLALLALWLFGAFAQSMAGHMGWPTPPGLHRLVWFGHFQMFTDLRPTHSRVIATFTPSVGAPGPAAPELVDLAALFPMDRHAGPGYTRGSILPDPARLIQLSDAACAKLSPEAPGALALIREVWPKLPGQADQSPAAPPRQEILIERPCGQAAEAP